MLGRQRRPSYRVSSVALLRVALRLQSTPKGRQGAGPAASLVPRELQIPAAGAGPIA